jgi:hypothetical protein
MKEKTIASLRNLLEEVADHEAETSFSAVSVDLADLKRVLRWAQNSAYIWFVGDRVKRTGASVPYGWLEMGMEGTVISEDHGDGRARVEWDGGPEDDGENRVWMFHNEIKKVK